MKARLLIAAALLADGCAPEPTPLEAFEPITHVHAVLVAGAESASVFVTRPTPGLMVENWQSQITTVPVHDAVVALRGDDVTVILTESTADTTSCIARTSYVEPLLSEPGGCYVARIEGGITPGTTYDLEVALPDGLTVRGSTTVPAIPVITAPAPGAEVRINTDATPIKVEWTADRPAFGAEAVVLIDGRCPVFRERALRKIQNGTDSIFVRQRYYSFCPGPDDRPQLVLALYDSAYAEYSKELARSRHSIRHGRTAFGLNGAVGVFGSIGTASLPVTVCRDSSC